MPSRPVHRPNLRRASFLALTLLSVAIACTPTLDWREVRPEGTHLALMFPCKPVGDARNLDLQGRQVRMYLHACKAASQSFALSYADVGDPALVGPALKQMRESLVTKLSPNPSETAASAVSLKVNGMTPNALALAQPLSGQLPDGSTVFGVVAVFARGTVVYQAVVLGRQYDAVAQEGFVNAIKFLS